MELTGEAIGLVTVSLGGIVRSFDESAEQIFRCPAAEIVGKPLKTILNGTDGCSPSRRAIGKRRDGGRFPANIQLSQVGFGSERLQILAVRDVASFLNADAPVGTTESRYRSLVEQLRESERWWAATLRSIAESVVATDADWRIRFMNPAAEKLTGWTSIEAAGRDVAQVLRVSMPLAPRGLGSADPLTGGGATEGTLVARDGSKRLIEERSTLIRDDAGQVMGLVIALRERADSSPSDSPDFGEAHILDRANRR